MTKPRDIEHPEPGHWLVTLARRGVQVPAAIVRVTRTFEPGAPLNMREWGYLAAFIDGEPVMIDEVWLRRLEPIDEAEYKYRVADAAHARKHRPDDPKARPREAVDFNKLKFNF